MFIFQKIVKINECVISEVIITTKIINIIVTLNTFLFFYFDNNNNLCTIKTQICIF